MADYIDREVAVSAAFSANGLGNSSYRDVCDVVSRIRSIPAADVREVKRGKWIKYAPHNSDMMTCSECEKYWILDGDQYDYHFCPNCGADMRPEPPKEET